MLKRLYFFALLLLITLCNISCAKQEHEMLAVQTSFKPEEWRKAPILDGRSINQRLIEIPSYDVYDLDRDYRRMKYGKEKCYINHGEVIFFMIEVLKLLESGDKKLIAYYTEEMTLCNVKPSYVCKSLDCLKGYWSEKRINEMTKILYKGFTDDELILRYYTRDTKKEEFAYLQELKRRVDTSEHGK